MRHFTAELWCKNRRFCSTASAIATTMINCPLRITVFAPRYAVTAGSGQVQPEQPREMHPADVMDVAGDHTRAVGGNDAAQLGHRQGWALFGQQPIDPPPPAPIAAGAGHPP